MRTALIRLARAAGVALAIACIAYVAWRWQALRASAPPSLDLGRCLAAAALYTLCGAPLALAWLAALRAVGERSLPAGQALAGYLQTQFAKYLPGGFFHYAARHAHGRGRGAAHLPLAGATLLETLSLVLAASLFVLPGPPPPADSGLAWLYELRWLPLAVAVPAFALWLLRRRQSGAQPLLAAAGLGLHLSFFALSAVACGWLLPAWPPGLEVAAFAAAVAGAWLAGFVIIGAPGGLGVREAVLVTLLAPALGEAAALGLAVSYRLATMAGDAAMAAAGLALARLVAKPAALSGGQTHE